MTKIEVGLNPECTSRCTSRPNCPCDFCINTRVEMASKTTPRDKLDRAILDYINELKKARS